ncbi:GAP family protein [Microbacterium sp. SLBN-146]|uniref:GAP family protein n=1 Tax=Microbacterium sp. SLBN-146 TaxID=2768457 RepID=UPI00114DEA6C|nr:GAP family protein [Microbacterium sp. SLBN-146]TQJ32103.1 Sap-like sulfolipid-1-addressing protein [Microbacterium sp. SLBN-146]
MPALHTLIPMAVGMLISPLPIVAIIAILLSARGRSAAPAYAASFTLLAFVFTGLGAVSAAGASEANSGGGKVAVLILTILLTVGFTVLALTSWVSRPKAGAAPEPPAWLAAVDSITPARAAGLGLLMAVTNSKNIPLELKAGSVIGAAHDNPAVAAMICLLFAVAGSLAIILPTLLASSGSPAVTRALARLKSDMITHNAVIMTVLFAILAANEAAHLVHQLTA